MWILFLYLKKITLFSLEEESFFNFEFLTSFFSGSCRFRASTWRFVKFLFAPMDGGRLWVGLSRPNGGVNKVLVVFGNNGAIIETCLWLLVSFFIYFFYGVICNFFKSEGSYGLDFRGFDCSVSRESIFQFKLRNQIKLIDFNLTVRLVKIFSLV